jgi:hypothetical protein
VCGPKRGDACALPTSSSRALQGWSVVLNKFPGLQDHVLLVGWLWRGVKGK